MKKSTLLFTGFLLFVCLCQAQPGTLDYSFGTKGRVLLKGLFQEGFSVALQPDGKIVVGGNEINSANNNQSAAIARLNKDGSLDQSFGANISSFNEVFTGLGYTSVISDGSFSFGDLTIDSSGRIVVTMKPTNLGSRSTTIRLNANGTLDRSFGNNGFGANGGNKIALEPDGKILVLQYYNIYRLNTDGSLDASFDTTASGANLTVQPDGKVVVVGSNMAPYANKFNAIRLNTDGTKDLSFGNMGVATLNIEERSYAYDVTMNGNKIVVAGGAVKHFPDGDNVDYAIARLNTDGSPDLSFNGSGYNVISFNTKAPTENVAYAVKITDSDQVVVNGYMRDTVHGLFHFGIAELKPDGTLNRNFNGTGKLVVTFDELNGHPHYDVGYDLAVQKDGKLVAAGFSLDYPEMGFAVARINNTGTWVSNYTLSCPPDKIVNPEPGLCWTTVNGIDPVVTPAGSLVQYTTQRNGVVVGSGLGTVSQHRFEGGKTVVTYTVVADPSQTCSFTVTVRDTIPPKITCPPAAYLCFSSNSQYTLPAPVVSDACGLYSLSYHITGATVRNETSIPLDGSASGNFQPGTSLVTYTVKDVNGNTSSCDQTVVIDRPMTVTIGSTPSGNRVTLTANVNGGTMPYSYLWSTGETTPSITVLPQAQPGMLQHMEAENYYSSFAVTTEPATDAGGGQDVGQIDDWHFTTYFFSTPHAGMYTMYFRVASMDNDAQLQVRDVSGAILATVYVPNTGGWQNWQTVSANIILPQGYQLLKIISSSQEGNRFSLNWLELGSLATPQFTGTPTHIEAQHYNSMYGVELEPTYDEGGGSNLAYVDPGDWVAYNINIPQTGLYNFDFRVASQNLYSRFDIVNTAGAVLKTVYVPNTGGYQLWKTVSVVISLPEGPQTIRLVSTAPLFNNWNLNWFEFAPVSNDYTSGANNYWVSVTDSLGCKSTNAWNGGAPAFNVQHNASRIQTETTEKQFSLKAYPNPSNNSFTLQVSSTDVRSAARIIIFNTYGKKMEEREVLPGQVIRVGAAYRPGMYYAELIQNGMRKTVKMIKLSE